MKKYILFLLLLPTILPGQIIITSPSGSGSVTTVSVTTANGISGSVANASSTPAITLSLAAITPSTVNGNTFTTGTYTLTGGASKTLNFTNTLTLSGTDGTTMTFPSTSATLARTDAANTFTGTQTGTFAIASASTGTTQSAAENSTKVSTTAYTDRQVILGHASSNLGNCTGTINIDWSLSNNFRGTLTGNTTFTFSNATEGQMITVDVAQTGTNSYTVTWPTAKWSGGTAPTMTTGAATSDITTFWNVNSVFKGNSIQNVK